VERAPDRVRKAVQLWRLRGEVSGGLLRRNLDLGIAGNEVIRKRHTLHDFNSLTDQRVIFHVAHRNQPIDARYPEPVERVGHQLLETRIFNPRDAFGSLKVRRSHVPPFLPLARIVDQELRPLSERPPLLAIVDGDAYATRLSHARAFLDTVNEIGT